MIVGMGAHDGGVISEGVAGVDGHFIGTQIDVTIFQFFNISTELLSLVH